MTSLLSWIGVDQRGPASLYLAADSRITWFDGTHWDHGRKVFASSKFPELLGYCGEAFFPTSALGQITDLVDLGLLLDVAQKPQDKADRLISVLSRSLSRYRTYSRPSFELLYCTREDTAMRAIFRVFRVSFDRGHPGPAVEHPIPETSGKVAVLGSGRHAVTDALHRWQISEARGTSRAMFAAFGDAVRSRGDPKSGGSPQLGVMYRTGGARICGIVNGDVRSICGLELDPPESAGGIMWFNDTFEVCDGVSGRRRENAQPQPRPKNL